MFLQSIAAQAIGACNAGAALQGAFLAGPYAGPYDGFYGSMMDGCGPYDGYGSLAFAELYAGFPTPFAAAPFAAPIAAPFAAAPFAAAPYAGPAALKASNGGGLVVTSSSPIAPTGVSIISENAYDGPLAVSGSIPFLSAVALEGALPTAGAGAVTYGCGNGNVAMMIEDLAAPTYNAIAAPFSYNGYADAAYGYGMAGPYGYGPMACGCAF